MPMSAGALVGVLVAVVAVLSLTLIGSTMILDSQSFQIHAAQSQGDLVNSILDR